MNAQSSTSVALSPSPALPEAEVNVHNYMPMVYGIAKIVHRRIRIPTEMGDLISLGVIGLFQAIERYVPGGPARFSTFAYYRIRGAMLDGISTTAPRSRKAHRAMPIMSRYVSHSDSRYEKPSFDQEGLCLADHTTPESLTSSKQDISRLMKAMQRLTAAQRKLLEKHYWGDENLRAAGAGLGISKSWACRSHASALLKLRAELGNEVPPRPRSRRSTNLASKCDR